MISLFFKLVLFVINFNLRFHFQDSKQKESTPLLRFINDFGLAFDSFSIITSLFLIGFNASTLESQLKTFRLDELQIGFVFVINGTIYFMAGPYLGKLLKEPKVLAPYFTKFKLNHSELFKTLLFLILNIFSFELDQSKILYIYWSDI